MTAKQLDFRRSESGKIMTNPNDDVERAFFEFVNGAREPSLVECWIAASAYQKDICAKTHVEFSQVEKLVEALKSICGNRCAHQNPCEAREALKSFELARREGK